MKNRFTVILVGIAGMLALFSCKKAINQGPTDAPYEANFWDAQQSADEALAGAYGLLRSALIDVTSYFIVGDATANEFTNLDATGFGDLGSLSPDNNFNFHYVPYYEPILWDWSRFYQIISQCNLILAKVPLMPDSYFSANPGDKNSIIGQAYFLRAYTYFYLTKVWGQPVIVTKNFPNPLKAPPVARSTSAQGFEQADSDLIKSIGLLQYGYDNVTDVAVTADKGAAFALLAKVKMWQQNYQGAADAADSVITNGGYQLEDGDNYDNIFLGRDPESIFELNMLYTANQNEAILADGSQRWFDVFLSAPFIFGKSTNWHVNTDLVGKLFDTTSTTKDKRVKSIFYGLQNPNQQMMIKYSNVVYQNVLAKTSPYISNNLVIMRLAGIILLRAEALTKLNRPAEAVTLLNEIRERAGLDDYTYTNDQDLYYEIMSETGRELFGEGHWYFDLLRSGLLTDPSYKFSIDAYSQNRIQNGGGQWPLDLSKLLPQDPLMTQNSWWLSH